MFHPHAINGYLKNLRRDRRRRAWRAFSRSFAVLTLLWFCLWLLAGMVP